MDYPSNSERSKREEVQKEERVTAPVVKGTVETRKKSAARKIADIFIQDDLDNVKQYVVSDVIIPGIKDTIMNIMSMFFYGDTRGANRRFGSTSTSKVSYRSYFDSPSVGYSQSQNRVAKTNSGFEYDELIFETRGDAQLVLDAMEDIVGRYQTVSLFDMYDLAGRVPPHSYKNYGWTSVSGARITSVSGGYVIDMPKALPIQ